VTSLCGLDRDRFETCRSPKRLTVRAGRHVFRVRARAAAGNLGGAKTFRWRVL
jgi:hypothetical protein